jgi:hypothetical protein
MIVSISVAICSYLCISTFLTFRRLFKLLDLHEEHLFARAREQKSHTKSFAMQLRTGFLDDLLWPKPLLKKLRALHAWIKT